MTLEIFVEKTQVTMKLVQNNKAINPALEKGRKLKDGRRPAIFKGRVDSEVFSYYHDLSDLLTPLEVSGIKKLGFIKKGNTLIYSELITGLITGLDSLLKRNSIDPIRYLRHNGGNRATKAIPNRVDTLALKSFKMRGNIGEDSTSYKIVASFVEALKIQT